MSGPEEAKAIEAAGLLGSLETRIMHDLWTHGRSKVGEVLERLNEATNRPLAYNTVMSVMARLAEKDHLHRIRDGRAFVYEPTADPSGFLRRQAAAAAADVVEDFGELAVAGFVDTMQARPDLLRTLQGLMEGEETGDDETGAD